MAPLIVCSQYGRIHAMFIYKSRIFDVLLKDALESKGAVVVRGPKWCGDSVGTDPCAHEASLR